jgi:hypothetical protein
VIAFDRSTLGNDRAAGEQGADRAQAVAEDKRVGLLHLTKSVQPLRDIMSWWSAQVRCRRCADRKTPLAPLTQPSISTRPRACALRAEDALEHLGKAGWRAVIASEAIHSQARMDCRFACMTV